MVRTEINKRNGDKPMITLDVKYYSEEDYKEAKKFIAALRKWMPIYFHENSCNKINTTQLSSNDKR